MLVRFSVLGSFLTVFCRECKTSLWTPSCELSTQSSSAVRIPKPVSTGVENVNVLANFSSYAPINVNPVGWECGQGVEI